MMSTARHALSPVQLLRNAAGSPRALVAKLGRLSRALARWVTPATIDARLDRLVSLGVIDAKPTRIQLLVGSADMLRFWISPAAADYYRQQGIDYWFHQLLRLLDDPAGLVDPVGLLSEADVIIVHLLQVVHANPVYDLQLLSALPDGVAELERQLAQLLAGTHPRQTSIGSIVEEADYHARLLVWTRAFATDARTAPMLRANIANDLRWAPIERTFGSLTTAMRYFCRMPADAGDAVKHLVTVRTFPVGLAEP